MSMTRILPPRPPLPPANPQGTRVIVPFREPNPPSRPGLVAGARSREVKQRRIQQVVEARREGRPVGSIATARIQVRWPKP